MQPSEVLERGAHYAFSAWRNFVLKRKGAPAVARHVTAAEEALDPAVANNTPADADTFCVLAWNHLQIAPNGTAKMCCIAGEDIHDNKRPMSLYVDTYEDIWNSSYMQRARRLMAEGKRHPACMRCYQEEKSVGESRRTIQNGAWLSNGKTREQLIENARSAEWKVVDRPEFLQLNMGNLCNLACRMCSSQYSSKIESDPIHNKWMPAAYPDVARWRGRKLHFGPRPLFGVSYIGFHEYEVGHGTSLRWSQGRASIKFAVPPKTDVTALGMKLRSVGEAALATIRLNGLEVYEGKIGPEWDFKHESVGLDNYAELEVEIDVPATNVGGRLLGVGLLDAWIERAPRSSEPLKNERTLMRLSANEGWWAQPDVMFGEILGQPDRLRYIIFQGGEPLLVKEFDDILDVIIENGSANKVTFEIVSNLTVLKETTLKKLEHLKQINFGASIDGIGPILEYIRYPAEWATIEENIARLSSLSNVQVSFNTAVQAYNLMDLPNIFRYCDARSIDVHSHFLVGPRYLNVAVLPKAVRKTAIRALEDYLFIARRPANRASAEYAIRFLLETLSTQFRDEFDAFVKFTNDMDVSRGQSFAALYSDIIASFADDGLHWTAETLHAERLI